MQNKNDVKTKKAVQTLALVGGALLSSGAFAASMEAPKFYGKFSLGVINTQTLADDKRVWEVENQASRIGFKGDYKASENLSLIYQLEVGVNPSDSSKPIFSMRNSYLGVDGNFGQVIVGTFDTPLKAIQSKADLFNDTTFDMSELMAGEIRHKQSVQYSTGRLMDSTTVKINWLPSDDKNQDDGVSASVEYKGKIWSAALAFDSNVAGDGGVLTVKANPLNTVRTVWTVKPAAQLQLNFLAQMAEGVKADKTKEAAWLVSAAWSIDKFKLKTQIGQGLGKKDAAGAESDAKISHLTLGLDYAVAKNTTLFTYAGVSRYEKGAGGLALGEKENRSTAGVGLTYKF